MGWVQWLKGLADLQARGDDESPGAAAQPRRPRNGGDAYAREWVKVLEDSSPERDPSGTYTWELQKEGPPVPAIDRPVARTRPSGAVPADPADTYTWELQEADASDDPWGLKKKDAPEPIMKKKDGVNPYDTGIFEASWTGKFDRR